jgi:hypothetical protein
MNRRIVPFDPSVHRAVQELLPWMHADTLSDGERALVRTHLQTCALCRADGAWQERLRQREPEFPTLDVEAGLRRTLARLDGREAAPPPWRRWSARIVAWAAPLIAVQCAVIAALALQLAAPQAAYRTLGGAGAEAGNALAMFRPDTAEADLRGMLQRHGATIVAGPTAAGAYVLNVPDRAALAALRREPGVALAEPLDRGATP